MGVLDVLRGITGGVAQASGNTAAANGIAGQQERARQAKANDLKMQLAPLTQAAQATQTRLALFADPNDPSKPVAGKEAEYAAAHDQLADIIGKQRMLLRPPPAEDPHGLSYLGARVADKLHITRDLANHMREAQSGKVDKYYQQGSKDVATAVQGIQPYQNTPVGQAGAEKAAQAQALETQRAKSASDVEAQRAASALAVEQERNKGKAPKGLKAMAQGSMVLGVEDQDTGKQYLPSQLGPTGNAPPEAKQMWSTIQQQKAAKLAEDQRKEDEIADRQSKTIAAGFERMGQSQQFQEAMAQYRSDLTTYRSLDTVARNSEETVKALENQYSQPGNKAAADNELQNFYTTVVQKGGRKTAAELALTLKIGSFGLNLQQIATKAASGELPDALRKSLLDGMKAIASEQRSMADTTKPELPKVNVPEGTKTKELKGTRNQLQGDNDPLGLFK